jgi:ribosomal protein S18 acetylase RimI-like enzyme
MRLTYERPKSDKSMPDSELHPSPYLRRAQAGDETTISSVLFEAFREYLPKYTLEGFAATTPSPAEVLRRMAEGPVWLALTGSEVVATVSAVLREGGVLYIRGMAVLPKARGLRIGSLLFELTEQYAIEHGCKKLILSTTPFLDRAIRLYERLGFVRTDADPHDLHGTPLFTMERQVRTAVRF